MQPAHSRRRASILCAALASFTTAVRADTLVLADGRIFEGLHMSQTPQGVDVQFKHGLVSVPQALVHLALIEGAPAYEAKDEAEKEKLAQGLVPFEGEWIAAKRREELIAKRIAGQRALVEEMLAHREWKDRRITDTKDFHFEYTVPEHVCQDFRDKMEAYYSAFAKEWKIKAPKKDSISVCFYGSSKEYYRSSGAPWGAIAYFKFLRDPDTGRYDLNVYYDRGDPTFTEQVIFHESNHYLQKLIDEGFHYPHWPGEALAEYYGASHWDPEKKKLTVGLVQEGRLAEVQEDVAAGKPMGLLQMLSEERMYEHYTWGWSLVHFLMNDTRYQAQFKRFFLGLASATDVHRTDFSLGLRTVEPPALIAAFRDYLGLKKDGDMAELERQWHAYVEGLFGDLTVRGREKAALSAMQTDRPLRAKRLFQEALDGGSTDPNVYHQFAKLIAKDDLARASELWKKAIELGPLNGAYYMALGRALKASNPKECERLVALAHEIDPELDEEDYDFHF
jgi:hypothetical protein